MRENNQQIRQGMGCGYEPSVPGAMPWSPLGMAPNHWTGAAPAACVGYTRKLPEVIEVVRAWKHWSKSQLSIFTQGEQPSEALVLGVEILDGQSNQFQSWSMTPKDKGGGGA